MSTAVATPVAIAPADAAAAVPVTAAAPSSAMPAASAAAVAAAAAAAAASAPAAPQPYASASLYVGDLAVDVTEALLFEIFNAVGPVASVRVCRDAATRRSLGYAYVNFHRLEDAERALDTLNFKNIRNRACRIMWSHRDPSLRRSGLGNIFVNHLAKDIDNKALYDTFSVFGNILSCKVATNGKRESLGYGFVHYETDESALTAIQRVDGKVISNQQVSVQKFVSKKDRPSAQLAKNRFTNVFIKNLQLDISVAKLEEMFKSFGTITSATVNVPADRTDEKARAFGFVNFETPEQAQAAVDAGNQMEINGKKLFAARAQKKEERRQELAEKFENLKLERAKKYAGVNLYVKNLSDEMEDERLTQEFSKYGAISSATVMKDPATNKSRGFGFVCYTTPDDATRAVTEMNGRMVDGKPLYVALAQRKEQRRAQLEAQYAARQKLGGGAAGGVPAGAGLPLGAPGVNMPYNPAAQLANMPFMFPAQAQQLQMQQQRLGFNYPQQLMAAAAAANQHMRWNPAAAAAQQNMMAAGMVAGQPHLRNQLNYQLMPANAAAAAAAAAAMNLNMSAAAARQMQGMNPNGPRANTPRQNGNGPRGPMNGPVMPQGGPLTNPAVAAAAAAAGRGPLPQQNIRYNDNVRNQQPANANATNAAPRPAQAVAAPVGEALTAAALAAAPEEMRKQMIGERLFPLVRLTEPDLAGKITGMLLEMDNGELLHLLESREALSDKISEALQVLHQHGEEEQ